MKLLNIFALVLATGLLGACVPDARQPATSGQAGCDTSIRFENTSSITVTNLYYKPAPVATWGSDRLGQNVLRPGATTNVRLSHARPYDFRVVYENGRSAELRNVDVCRVSRVAMTTGIACVLIFPFGRRRSSGSRTLT